MTTTILPTTTRPAHGTSTSPRARSVSPATAAPCTGTTPQHDCPFCSGPETD